MINKTQLLVVATAFILFIVLYFGCETKPATQKALEQTRALAIESTDINALLQEARLNLDANAATNILAIENQLENNPSDSLKTNLLKQLSGEWYRSGHPAISAYYAEEIAEIEGSEEAWSIAGTTYTICVQRSEVEKVKSYCTGRAIKAFENATSINPTNLSHQTNLALVYTENPPKENPMKGILMLVDLNKKYPEDVSVLTNLGRLAIKTGQFQRATERLQTILKIEPNNRDAICLLAQAYDGLGQVEDAQKFAAQCQESLQ